MSASASPAKPPNQAPGTAAESASADSLAGDLLRATLSQHGHQAGPGFVGLVIISAPTVVVLGHQLPLLPFALWFGLLLLLQAHRFALGQRCLRLLQPKLPMATLGHWDRLLRWNSLATQAVAGALVWLLPAAASDQGIWPGSSQAQAVVTLALVLYGLHQLLGLHGDSRSSHWSMPVLMAQPVLFWLLQGGPGISVAFALVLLAVMMLHAGNRTRAQLVASLSLHRQHSQAMQQLQQAKQAAEAALGPAEEANRSKSLFMAAASHDLRQPLYAIRLLQETLSMQDLPDNLLRIVHQQGQAIETLSNLFDNLLDLSRFDSGRVEVRRSSVHLAQLFNTLAQEFEPQCAKKGLSLQVGPSDYWLSTDRSLLTRLLRNLLSNAVRYTSRGTINLSATSLLHTGTTPGMGSVQLRVADTGPGISSADQQRVFQEFVQLRNPQRDRGHGVGLGLAIVQRIARLLQHPVTLESAPDAGTCVCLEVPLAAIPKVVQPVVSELPSSPGSDIRVWVVEDDPLVQTALGTYLESLGIGHRIATSRSQIERLRAREGWPDYILLDDMLDEHETGLELANWINRHSTPPELMLMTGNSDPVRLQELENSGFALARKPVSAAVLRTWLAAADSAAGNNRPRPTPAAERPDGQATKLHSIPN